MLRSVRTSSTDLESIPPPTPMPYIDPDDRARIDAGAHPATPGELNYALTRLVDAYLDRACETEGRLRYRHINEAVGVLECAKLELYRRVAAPYEDRKIEQSGDVYAPR